MTDEPMTEGRDAAPVRRWSRTQVTVLAVLGALAFTLLGATAGLLLAPGPGANQRPNAVDVGFSQDMIVHHLQGVLMAHWAQLNSSSEHVQRMGYDIENTQLAQVGMMYGWLLLWGQPETPLGPVMSWMTVDHNSGHPAGHGADHGATTGSAPTTDDMTAEGTTPTGTAPPTDPAEIPLMPGMATDSEMARLEALRGTEFDIFFLQLMIRHHQGGVAMMEDAISNADTPVVRTLAGNMLGAQTGEISVMTHMLTDLGAEPLPF